MLKRCRSVLTRTGLVAAIVTATSLSGVTAAAANGPPEGGGGCHMVASPSSTGLTQMMAGSAGSANGIGADNMAAMLSRFSPEPFCGL
jgi:phosphotransacetylase